MVRAFGRFLGGAGVRKDPAVLKILRRSNLLGLPSLQKCVCEMFGEI